MFDGPTSHTPTPEITQIVAVTISHCAMPPAIARKPNTRNGTVLASRCGQPPCSSGAHTMPPSPDSERDTMPSLSSDSPVSWSTSSITYSSAVKASMTSAATTGCGGSTRATDRRGAGAGATMPPRLRAASKAP